MTDPTLSRLALAAQLLSGQADTPNDKHGLRRVVSAALAMADELLLQAATTARIQFAVIEVHPLHNRGETYEHARYAERADAVAKARELTRRGESKFTDGMRAVLLVEEVRE